MRLLCTEHGQQATRQYTYGSLNNSEEIGALHFYNIDTTKKCTKDIKRVKKIIKILQSGSQGIFYKYTRITK